MAYHKVIIQDGLNKMIWQFILSQIYSNFLLSQLYNDKYPLLQHYKVDLCPDCSLNDNLNFGRG